MEFNSNKIYYMHLPPATFGNLPPAKLEEIFSDGRHLSSLVEALVDHNFDNITYQVGNKSTDYKYVNGSDKPLEMRGFPLQAKTANLIPSNMIGAGRKYNEAEYINKLNLISGFIIVYPINSYRHLLMFSYSASQELLDMKKKINRLDVMWILGINQDLIFKDLTDRSKIQIIENQVYEFDKPFVLPPK